MTSPSHDQRWQRPDDLSPGAASPRPGSASLVDPEDDLPSPTYAGDFETTTIPHYDVVAGAVPSSPAPEPLPYAQPVSERPAASVGPAEIEADDDSRRRADKRGTQDLGLLLLRAGFGALLIAHGLQKVFGWWGGSGLGSFGDSLADAGYQHANVLTYVAAGTQITAGVLLVLGLFTPLAAAAALAYLLNGLIAGVAGQSDPREFAFFLPSGHEYQLTLIVVAATIILVGPGRYGFDAGRGWARRPFIGSFVALLLGIGGGIAIWVFLHGGNPLG
ncbi:MAG TPA: DoxX family protein [Mycobacterium sp.]|nr:DoxX family protein [Mycobacterium sp.]